LALSVDLLRRGDEVLSPSPQSEFRHCERDFPFTGKHDNRPGSLQSWDLIK